MTHSMDEMLAVFQKRMIADLKRGYPDYVMDGEDSLVFAMKDVYAHTKCPFIILIDEWDCLFREYKQDKEAQKKYLDFLRAWLKDKDYVTDRKIRFAFGTQHVYGIFHDQSTRDGGVFRFYRRGSARIVRNIQAQF